MIRYQNYNDIAAEFLASIHSEDPHLDCRCSTPETVTRLATLLRNLTKPPHSQLAEIQKGVIPFDCPRCKAPTLQPCRALRPGSLHTERYWAAGVMK